MVRQGEARGGLRQEVEGVNNYPLRPSTYRYYKAPEYMGVENGLHLQLWCRITKKNNMVDTYSISRH